MLQTGHSNLQSLALFHRIIPMDALEESLPLYNVHLTKVFPFPPGGGALEVGDIPDRHRAGGNVLFINDFNLQDRFTSANSNRPW